jgi:hypothetical protein
MEPKLIAKIAAAVLVLGGLPIAAGAASLPPPAKLCALLTGEGFNIDKWQGPNSNHLFWCSSSGHIFPSGADTGGVVWMAEYDATGSTKTHVSRLYFKIEMFDNLLRNDQISAPMLSRISAIFAASSAGDVPGDLVKAIKGITTASVSTKLGVVRTRFTPVENADQPYNGATFEVQLDSP